jgi:leucine dehydrogenase
VILDLASGQALKDRGILYAPDFIINAGGVINAAGEAAGAYNEKEVLDKCYNIYNTVERILRESQETGTPEGVIATQFAEDCIYGRA